LRSGRWSESAFTSGPECQRGDLRPEAQPCRPSGYQFEHREASAADIQHRQLLGGDGGDTAKTSNTNTQASEAAKIQNPAPTIPRFFPRLEILWTGAVN